MNQLIKRVFALKIRRRRRYKLRNGAYVVLSNFPGRYEIEEIGYGGLSFHYIDNGRKTNNGSQNIKIVSENHLHTVHLAGRIVSENETGELIFEKKKIKRRSIRFDKMNNQTKVKLESFIKNNA
ncbi:MAG: hypothetical protein PVH87_03470 [Desulfobacteraceae bacterium]|jgi:hypothetical protein